MSESRVVQQVEFECLDDFIRGQNNFYAYFLDDRLFGEIYREKPPFKRFQSSHPEMERDLSRTTVQAIKSEPEQRLPYEQLWEAYKIMSRLVFIDDADAIIDGQPDQCYLIR